MKKLNCKSGFTLIEIIVVLIIVGVLAAIALPNLFSNVQKAQGGEAVSSLGAQKSIIEGCIMGHVNSEQASCGGIAMAGTAHFNYAFGTALTNGASGGNYTLVATNVLGGALGTVVLTKSTIAPGSLTCSGTQAYQGVC